MSAAVQAKGERYLLERRVEITCSERGIEAKVEGDTGTWTLYREPHRWRCTCPSWKRCSHLEAVERVTRP